MQKRQSISPSPFLHFFFFRRCKNFFPLPRLTLSLSRGATNQPSNQTSHRHQWRRVPKDNGAKGFTKNAPKINNHEKIALLNICRAWFLNLFYHRTSYMKPRPMGKRRRR